MPKPFQSTARTESWNELLLQMGGSKLMLMRPSMSQNKKQGCEQLLEIAEAKLLLQQSRESHLKEVVELALSKKSSKAEISWRIAEIQEKMKVQTSASITYVSRSCNSIAHYLAKAALDFDKQVLWLGNFPEQVTCITDRAV